MFYSQSKSEDSGFTQKEKKKIEQVGFFSNEKKIQKTLKTQKIKSERSSDDIKCLPTKLEWKHQKENFVIRTIVLQRSHRERKGGKNPKKIMSQFAFVAVSIVTWHAVYATGGGDLN